MQRFVIDCRNVARFEDFVEALNAGLIRDVGGEWNGNLDALNDYLCWPMSQSYELEILGSDACGSALARAELARKLNEMLEACHPTNRAEIEARLERARQGRGPTLFDLLRQIIEADARVRLILS